MDKGIKSSQIQAVGNRVVIKQEMDKDFYEQGGLKLWKPDTYKDNTTVALRGEIVNMGDKVENFKIGQNVMFHKYVGYDLIDETEGNRQIYKVIDCEDIIAVINDFKGDTNEDSMLNNGKLA